MYYGVEMTREGITQIEVTVHTREKLKKLRITKRETYDEIINRLIGEKI